MENNWKETEGKGLDKLLTQEDLDRDLLKRKLLAGVKPTKLKGCPNKDGCFCTGRCKEPVDKNTFSNKEEDVKSPYNNDNPLFSAASSVLRLFGL